MLLIMDKRGKKRAVLEDSSSGSKSVTVGRTTSTTKSDNAAKSKSRRGSKIDPDDELASLTMTHLHDKRKSESR